MNSFDDTVFQIGMRYGHSLHRILGTHICIAVGDPSVAAVKYIPCRVSMLRRHRNVLDDLDDNTTLAQQPTLTYGHAGRK